MDRVKRIWCLSPMRAAKVQASLRIRAVSPEPSLLAHTSSESRRTFRQKARSLAPRNGWACAVEICHDGMLEDTNSLDGAQIVTLHNKLVWRSKLMIPHFHRRIISNTKADNMLWSRSGLFSKETTDKWLAPVVSNQNSVVYKKKKIIFS